jgi:hypothetical protein
MGACIKPFIKRIAGILLMLAGFAVQAQFRAPGGLPSGFHHALLDALTGQPAFYGQATVQLSGAADGAAPINCNISSLSGNLRVETAFFQPGTNMPSAEAAQLRNMRSVTILRPDRNRMYLVFPTFQSFVELAYGRANGSDPVPAPKITKTVQGKETVSDLKCEKSQWNVTETDGEQFDLTLWQSPAWGNFPIQVKVGSPPTLVVFQDLHLDPPDSSLFEPPAGYTKYEGIQDIIRREAEQSSAKTNAQ